jgi:drug/metabolite transporter (DMT)-like permease
MNGPDRSYRMGMASLAMVMLTWSFGPALSKRVTTPPLVSVFYRMTIAAVVQWVFCLVLRRPPSLALLRRTFLPGALFALNNLLFFNALAHASVANTTLLVSLQPVLVLLLARPLFGEVVRRWDVGWTAVALVGVAIAVLGANAKGKTRPTEWVGVLLALCSMLAFATYFLLAKYENARADRDPPHPLTYMTAIITAGAITSVPFVVIGGKAAALTKVTHKQWVALALVIVVPTIGHLFMTFAHRHIDAKVSSLVLLIQPVTSALIAWWLVHQPVVWAQAIGGAIVVASIAAVTLRPRARRIPSPPVRVDAMPTTAESVP